MIFRNHGAQLLAQGADFWWVVWIDSVLVIVKMAELAPSSRGSNAKSSGLVYAAGNDAHRQLLEWGCGLMARKRIENWP